MDCLEAHWWAFSVLQKLGKLNVTALRIESQMESSFDTVLYSKLFFSQETHEHLRRHFHGQYDPKTDYAQQLAQHYEVSF